MSDIHYFSVLQKLKLEFEPKIKFVYIFGENNVIIVTETDQVFAFGNNETRLLGFGHNNAIKKPTQVMELCDKQITQITDGSKHMMALTESGKCFSWGDNTYGQLGNGTQTVNYKPIIIKSLNKYNIKAMSCGYNHSLVLTKSGQIFAFGYNGSGELGIGNNTNQSLPTLMINGMIEHTVMSISCGQFHSLALTQNGEVFSWGRNTCGELGIGNNIARNIPTKVKLIGNIVITKISCGLSHSMLLSNDGSIYMFGSNHFGQIGNRNELFQNTPQKVIKAVLFIDIATHYRKHISMALSKHNDYYVWGKFDTELITTPRRTRFKSFNEIFFYIRNPEISYKADLFDEEKPNSQVFNRLSKAFNNLKKSNLRLKIENKYIYVQKTVVKLFCKHFESMLSEYYFAFVKYLYTNCVESKDVEELIDLLDLANNHLGKELKHECFEILEKVITIENFSVIYSASLKYKYHELKDYCFDFAMNKIRHNRKTESFKKMDSDHSKNLLDKLVEFKDLKFY